MKSEFVTFCYNCKKHKDSHNFRSNAEVQVCFSCAKELHNKLIAKGVLRDDEKKALLDFNKTIEELQRNEV